MTNNNPPHESLLSFCFVVFKTTNRAKIITRPAKKVNYVRGLEQLVYSVAGDKPPRYSFLNLCSWCPYPTRSPHNTHLKSYKKPPPVLQAAGWSLEVTGEMQDGYGGSGTKNNDSKIKDGFHKHVRIPPVPWPVFIYFRRRHGIEKRRTGRPLKIFIWNWCQKWWWTKVLGRSSVVRTRKSRLWLWCRPWPAGPRTVVVWLLKSRLWLRK